MPRHHTPPTLDVLLPTGHTGAVRLAPREDESELVALFADAAVRPDARVHVRANMVSTLDGAATGPDRRSGSINDEADHRVFTALRALADVVLIGAGTARTERYEPLRTPDALQSTRRAHGRTDELELALVTASGAVPEVLLDAARPPLVLTVSACPSLELLRSRIGPHRVLVAGDDQVDLPTALDLLADRGLVHVLTEGGPRLLSDLLAADLVDELCLTWTPLVVGGPAPRATRTDDWFEPVHHARPRHLLHADGTLLGRWVIDRLTP
ncbi:dihydrofolate reductase family protein [Cellulomonas soli]|uniref:dihydrofolate reductase family protein n=1 Tax=Cellulomonas soli TaxID=931535 RepID=UPI003F828E6A